MVNRIIAQCPGCKAPCQVTVGQKSTARKGRCSVCRTTFGYSAWVIKQTPDQTFTQVDFFIDKLGRTAKSPLAAAIGRKGGLARSAAKAAAARSNGQRGGRPPREKGNDASTT